MATVPNLTCTTHAQAPTVSDWNQPFARGSFWEQQPTCDRVIPAYKPGYLFNAPQDPQPHWALQPQKRACVVYAPPTSAQRDNYGCKLVY